ncbi:replicative DNA helicase [Streptomyces fungicidicus]|uniref:replicative DNA helicase n=1 Tax=Streptomyces fungicidicus TaxID=68203 RepID=UPI0033220205
MNYQAIGKILNGKNLPTPRQVTSLASWLIREGSLCGKETEEASALIEDLLELREAAHREELGIASDRDSPPERQRAVAFEATSTVATGGGARNERKLLSCLLQSKDAIADVVELLPPKALADKLHVAIYVTILQLYADGSDIRLDAVEQAVTDQTPASIDVRTYLDVLMREDIEVRDAELYAERAVDFAKLRKIAALGEKFTELAKQSNVDEAPDVDGLVALVEDDVYSFINETKKLSSVDSVLEGALDEVEANGVDGGLMGVPSGIRDFDALTMGFRRGELIIVAGASSIGKSNLGISFARTCSIAHSRTSLLVSLQMGREEVAMRMLAAEARVALHHMRSGAMTDDDWTRLSDAMPSTSEAPLYVQDEAVYTISQLMQNCKQLSILKNLRLVVIDSLDLIETDREHPSVDYDRNLMFMARDLRKLAKELNLTVVALMHIDRPPNRPPYDRPEIRDVPGSVERFADMVILLHREDAYDRESPRAGEADLIVAKNRSGSTAIITVAYQGHYARFVDL